MKRKAKILFMDVDGTLTDGKIYIGKEGEMLKTFNIKDGCGIHDLLISANIMPVIITGRQSDILIRRCQELGITNVYQNVQNKAEKVKCIAKDDLDKAAYIGDDINDLPPMELVKEAGGIVGCPADAVKQVREIADFVAEHNGGNGAVRDFIDWLLDYSYE